MKKIILLGTLLLLMTSLASAAVVKGIDVENSCVLYRVAPIESDGKVKLRANEVIIYGKDVYGLSFQNMEINFDNREVSVQPMINIVLGINRPLISDRVVIAAENPNFNFLINQLNRKILLFEKICISDGKIVYANMFENP